ncbi:MAG: TetR family transcriptional regulator [Bacteroidetes bacterium]|nr:TetR family transcriptional regulator [Bacteroidota bacterium]
MPNTTTDLHRVILDATRSLLARHGYTNLSMRKIAKKIGYSATTIYLHFENKDALFHALIDEGMNRLYESLYDVHAQYADAPVERLRALCRQYIQFGLDEPEYYEVMFMLHPEHMERYPAAKYRRARRNLDLFAQALEDGVTEGVMAVQNSRVAASSTWAALHGTVTLLIAQRVDARINHEAFITAAIDQALYGLLPRTHADPAVPEV